MWKVLLAIIATILVIVFFDFSFLNGEIVEYPLSCDKKNYVDYECTKRWLPLNPTTYKPNVGKQQVLYWNHAGGIVNTLKKCSIRNRSHWTCKYDDESAEFGFDNGQFWEIPSKEGYFEKKFVYKYVPKFIYILEIMKW